MLESVTPNPDDSGNTRSRSGVFRRIMARDLYDVTKRVEQLEQSVQSPMSMFLTSWPQIIVLSVLGTLVVGSVLYLDHRGNRIEALQRQERLALRSELDAQKFMIEELQQTLRAQSQSLRTMSASLRLAAVEPGLATIAVEDADSTSTTGSSLKSRTALPAFLLPGEVLLIVASTLTEEEAVDQAEALESDGHASEVILGMSGYYGVALGRFDFEQAKNLKLSMIESGAVNTPYLVTDESVDAYVYP